MAELAKKLHFKKDGTIHTAKMYSTEAEVGAAYTHAIVDGIHAYTPLGAENNQSATMARVKETDGRTYAILSTGKPPYTEDVWTTPGTYTWTAPSGVNRVRVAVCGGGGGYCAVVIGHYGWEDDLDAISPLYGGTGGTSTFGNLMTATGGSGGIVNRSQSKSNGSGGSPNGRAGTGGGAAYHSVSTSVGGSGFSLSFDITNNPNGPGTGGGCYFNTNAGDQIGHNAAGGSGGYDSGYVSVTPGQTYTVVVGAAGAVNYRNMGSYASTVPNNQTGPANGFVYIAYGGDI